MSHRIHRLVGIACFVYVTAFSFRLSNRQYSIPIVGKLAITTIPTASTDAYTKRFRWNSYRRCSLLHSIGDGSIGLDADNGVPVDVKREALMLLDCLTSCKDPDDPEYDVEKDVRRDELLLANDYNDLKNDLRSRGLRTSGDKLEMITRLLLHIIDPSIKFDEMYVSSS